MSKTTTYTYLITMTARNPGEHPPHESDVRDLLSKALDRGYYDITLTLGVAFQSITIEPVHVLPEDGMPAEARSFSSHRGTRFPDGTVVIDDEADSTPSEEG